MPFTRTNRQAGSGRRDRFGNSSKNVFCKETQSKNGTIGYKGYIEINGRLYAMYFSLKTAVDKRSNPGCWLNVTEYSQTGNRW